MKRNVEYRYNLNLNMDEFMDKFYKNYHMLFDMEDLGFDMSAYIDDREYMMCEFDDLFDSEDFLNFLREFVKRRGDGIDTSFEQIAYMTTLKAMQKRAA